MKTANERAETVSANVDERANREVIAADKAGRRAVKLWQRCSRHVAAAAVALGRLVFDWVDGRNLAEVTGCPIATTYTDASRTEVKTQGLDLRWGIEETAIRDLRDLGGLSVQAEVMSLPAAPTVKEAARKLLAKLPKNDEGKQFRGCERYSNDESRARLELFSLGVTNAERRGERVSEIKLAQQIVKDRTGGSDEGDAAGGTFGDLLKAVDGLSKALAGLAVPEEDADTFLLTVASHMHKLGVMPKGGKALPGKVLKLIQVAKANATKR